MGFSGAVKASGLPVKSYALAAGRAESTAHRWATGVSSPGYEDIKTMAATLEIEGVCAIARDLFGERGVFIPTAHFEKADLCLNRARTESFEATDGSNRFGRWLHESLADGRVEDEELQEGLRLYGRVKQALNRAMAAAEHNVVHRRRAKR